MPRGYLMTWDAGHRRWQKMHKGQWHRVPCSQLGIPESQWTKEGSYQAANQWWERRLAEQQAA